MNFYKGIAEFMGTYIFLLVIIITGNAVAIGATLSAMIYLFGGISGGNFNPAVTIMLTLAKKQPVSELVPYVIFQVLGGISSLYTYKLLKSNNLLAN